MIRKEIENRKIHRVLLIDDDSITNTLNSMVIEKLLPEVSITTCFNGEMALEVLFDSSYQKPDVILLDINMPLMNAWEFLDELVRRGFSSEIHMLTSSQDPIEKENALNFSFVKSYHFKPLDYLKFQMIAEASGFEI